LKDSYLQKGKRRQLVEGIRKKGIRDERVLKAMEELPRHFFMAKDFESWSYEDKAFPIGNDQTISQPYTVAYQSSLLDVHPREKILEIGTGSGYQAAILSLLGGRIYTIERQKELYDKTRKLLKKLGFGGIRVFYKDGYLGLPEFAPFDKILVTAGAPEIPVELLKQLEIGGKIVVPVGRKVQKMYCITRLEEDNYDEKIYDDFRFVPFLKGTD
jgi:protein-L-isoaspartate(D-aspartate) O-methyltransferase